MKKLFVYVILLVSFLAPFTAAEASLRTDFRNAVKNAKIVGTGEGAAFPSLSSAIGRILQSLLAFIGTLILVVVIYAGFLWATSSGNEEKIKRAKGMLVNGVIGLIIIVTSAYLVGFVVDLLQGALK